MQGFFDLRKRDDLVSFGCEDAVGNHMMLCWHWRFLQQNCIYSAAVGHAAYGFLIVCLDYEAATQPMSCLSLGTLCHDLYLL